MDVKVNDKVVCISNGSLEDGVGNFYVNSDKTKLLTIGKVYTILDIEWGGGGLYFYEMVNDDGDLRQ